MFSHNSRVRSHDRDSRVLSQESGNDKSQEFSRKRERESDFKDRSKAIAINILGKIPKINAEVNKSVLSQNSKKPN